MRLKLYIEFSQVRLEKSDGDAFLRAYSKDDLRLEPFKEAVLRHVHQSEVLGMPYWVFVKGHKPVGVLYVGREPIQFFEPPGTPMAITSLVDPDQPKRVPSCACTSPSALTRARDT